MQKIKMTRSEAKALLNSNKSLKVEFNKDYPHLYFISSFEVLIMKQTRGDVCALFFKLKRGSGIYGGIILTQEQVDNFINRNFDKD